MNQFLNCLYLLNIKNSEIIGQLTQDYSGDIFSPDGKWLIDYRKIYLFNQAKKKYEFNFRPPVYAANDEAVIFSHNTNMFYTHNEIRSQKKYFLVR